MPDKEATRSLGHEEESEPKVRTLRTNHLLIIGIDKYQHGIPRLNNAVRDAKEFRKVLVEKYKFEESQVQELYDQQATRRNIMAAFDRFATKLTPEDNLIVYFSGHGELYEVYQQGYWIPVDAQLDNRSSYLSNDEVRNFFKYCKAHHIFGIVDSCFSGALFTKRKLTSTAERLDNIPSRWLLTAGRKEPVSDGSLGLNSPFATSLLTHLRGNDSPSLWTSQLVDRVLEGVVFNEEKQTPRGEPLQGAGHLGGQFVFYLKEFTPVVSSSSDTQQIVEPPRRNLSQEEEMLEEEMEPSSLEDLKMQLQLQVAEDMEQGLAKLKKVIKSNSRKSLEFIGVMGRFNRLRKQSASGIISADRVELTQNQIGQAIQYLINDLDEEDLKEDILRLFN